MSERPEFNVNPVHGGVIKLKLPAEPDVTENLESITPPTHGGLIPPKDYYMKEEYNG